MTTATEPETAADKDIDAQVNYTALCPKCGSVAGVTSNLCSAKSNAKWVARCIKSGLIVERMTTAEMRARPWCLCEDD